MVVVGYKEGVHLPGAGLWLDPRKPRDLAFVSHAHSDHTGFHKRILWHARHGTLHAGAFPPGCAHIRNSGFW